MIKSNPTTFSIIAYINLIWKIKKSELVWFETLRLPSVQPLSSRICFIGGEEAQPWLSWSRRRYCLKSKESCYEMGKMTNVSTLTPESSTACESECMTRVLNRKLLTHKAWFLETNYPLRLSYIKIIKTFEQIGNVENKSLKDQKLIIKKIVKIFTLVLGNWNEK